MNLNKKIILCIIVFWTVLSSAQAQTAIAIGEQGGDELVDMAVFYDNINVGGTFQQQLNGVVSLGGSDIILQQYNLLGQLNWAYRIGGQGNDNLRSMTCSPTGVIYSVGIFDNNLTFGANDTILNQTQQAIFISKHTQQGQLVWAKKITSKGFLDVKDILSDSADNIYLTGAFQDTFDVDATHQLISTQKNNLFLIKLDADGKVLWAKQATVFDASEGVAMTLDSLGNLFLTGTFKGFFSLGFDTLQAHVAHESIFLTKVDSSNGNWLWQKAFGGVYANNCTQLKWYQGHLYLGGYFTGILNVDSIQLITAFSNYTDGFIAKLNTDGTGVWASQSQTSAANCEVRDFSFYNNQLVLCGHYDNQFIWGGTQAGAQGGLEAFQLAMNLNGGQLTLQTWQGLGFDLPRATVVHSSGQVLTVGGFQQDISINNNNLIAQGFSDGFLVIQQPILLTSVPIILEKEALELSIFPNPTQDIVNILYEDGMINKWQLLDNQGRLLLEGTASFFWVEQFPKGTYILRILTNMGLVTKQLVVN